MQPALSLVLKFVQFCLVKTMLLKQRYKPELLKLLSAHRGQLLVCVLYVCWDAQVLITTPALHLFHLVCIAQ
jgi:hypothetical protein